DDADVPAKHIDRTGLIKQKHWIGSDGVAGEFDDLHRIALVPDHATNEFLTAFKNESPVGSEHKENTIVVDCRCEEFIRILMRNCGHLSVTRGQGSSDASADLVGERFRIADFGVARCA